MNPDMPEKKEPTREELYELVWSKPMTTAATELGISSVALAKRCRKFNVPNPPRGYWAKLAAGKKVPKPRLPEMIGGAEPQVPASVHHTQWPRDVQGLCDRAQALLTELKQLKPNYEGLLSLVNQHYPRTEITTAMTETAARLYHAILFAVERTGIPFRKARSKYEAGYFETQGVRLYLEIAETVKPHLHYQAWGQKKEGTGKMSVTLNTRHYERGWKKNWVQGTEGGLREIVAAIVPAITAYFAEQARQRAEEAERRRIEHERWLKEEEVRKQKLHTQTLVDIAERRATDFLHAVEWAHLHSRALAFIGECEARWKKEASALSPQQEAWLSWARKSADAWSPWLTGYPDPATDGLFDPKMVPFGGPYPETREFPRPPTMPEIKVQSADPWSSSRKQSAPFSLR